MKWLLYSILFISMEIKAEVSQDHVSSMIDQMVTNNIISREEAEKTKSRMLNMSPEQWKQINESGAKVAARTPASVNPVIENKIEEVNGIDLDSAQFNQIRSDIKKIVPQN